jgi:SAM-dependent methyltransferase
MNTQIPGILKQDTDNLLWQNIASLPYFRGLLRAVEARFYRDIELPAPILDLGCGDGHFAAVTFQFPIDIGMDPWAKPIREAASRGVYHQVIHGQGASIPFGDGTFASCFSNSVLEHIQDVNAVMKELSRVLKPGARFIFCVPNHQFIGNLSIGNCLDRLGLHSLANTYRRFFNRISMHYHCDPPEVWRERLEVSGFTIDHWWHYFSPGAFKVLEWGHYFGLPSWVAHQITRRWILVPQKWNLFLTWQLVNKYYHEADEQPEGSYTFYITHKSR